MEASKQLPDTYDVSEILYMAASHALMQYAPVLPETENLSVPLLGALISAATYVWEKYAAPLKEETDRLSQYVCDECDPDNPGWKQNRLEGTHVCVCIAESGPYQRLLNQIRKLRMLSTKEEVWDLVRSMKFEELSIRGC